MQKWEYAIGVHTYDDKTEDWVIEVVQLDKTFSKLPEMLNYMGEQGYELAGVSTFITTDFAISGLGKTRTDNQYFYFKRPKTE